MSFAYCDNGILHSEQQCASGLLFDSEVMTCVNPVETTCPKAELWSISTYEAKIRDLKLNMFDKVSNTRRKESSHW